MSAQYACICTCACRDSCHAHDHWNAQWRELSKAIFSFTHFYGFENYPVHKLKLGQKGTENQINGVNKPEVLYVNMCRLLIRWWQKGKINQCDVIFQQELSRSTPVRLVLETHRDSILIIVTCNYYCTLMPCTAIGLIYVQIKWLRDNSTHSPKRSRSLSLWRVVCFFSHFQFDCKWHNAGWYANGVIDFAEK